MHYIVYSGVMNVILISRLAFTFEDDGLPVKKIIVSSAIPIVAMIFFSINLNWILLMIYLLLYPIATWRFEKKVGHLNKYRAYILVTHLIVIGFLTNLSSGLEFNLYSKNAVNAIINFFSIPKAPEFNVLLFNIIFFGLLMIINEMNIFIRLLLRIFKLEPLKNRNNNDSQVDEQEYNTGRVIGFLERIFVFIFYLLGQYTALGFILAAKGITRFNDFKNRTFAEYVLIGTLLSTLCAMLMAQVVKLFFTRGL